MTTSIHPRRLQASSYEDRSVFQRFGLFVEGRHFGAAEAQARAYARNKANEWGRTVQVVYRSPINRELTWAYATYKPEVVSG